MAVVEILIHSLQLEDFRFRTIFSPPLVATVLSKVSKFVIEEQVLFAYAQQCTQQESKSTRTVTTQLTMEEDGEIVGVGKDEKFFLEFV